MSVWGRRQSYGATVFVVTFWVLLSTVAFLVQPFIERLENRDMASSDSDFMRQARFQSVKWRAWGDDAVLEARRSSKPIFLVAGASWGELREVYDGLFTVPEISEFLNQEYICVRVDSVVSPEWRSLPAPLVRGSRVDPRDFFIGVFKADGSIVDLPSREVLMGKNDATFLSYLHSQLDKVAAGRETPISLEAKREAEAMRGGVSSGATDVSRYIEANRDRVGRVGRLAPHELELLLDAGENGRVALLVNEYLARSIVDLIWGGFFEIWDGDFRQVRYVKSVFSNAGMLRVLSRLGAVEGDPVFIGAARWQFDYVHERFSGEMATSADTVDLGDAGRSIQYSFPRSRLRATLSGEALRLAEEDLGLVPVDNAQALARFVNREDWIDGGERLEPILAKLREKIPAAEVKRGETKSFEGQAEAVGSLLVAARLLGDQVRQEAALTAFTELRGRMRIGPDDVAAGPRDQPLIGVGLGTYLAYVGAAWEAMLLSGDSEIGWDGARVLSRALFLFRDDQSSNWGGKLDSFGPEWRKVIPPPVQDGSIRSATGEMIRLCDLYSNWRGSKSMRGEFIRGRDRAASQVSWVMEDAGPGFGGLGRAVRQVYFGQAIGVDGDVDWAELERDFPGVPVVPVENEGVAGFRFMIKGTWTGPHSLMELRQLVR